jgi:inorganic triphosphatase YgiF
MSEIELKFEVTPEDLKRLGEHPAMAGPGERVSLSTVYFDTPGGDLRAAGLSLRVRRKGEKYTQTLKRTRSDELFDRDEWEDDTDRFAPNLSLLAHTPVAQILDTHAQALRPQFSLKVSRDIHVWRDRETEIEISVDRGEVRAGELTEPLLELELELRSGAPERLYAFAEELFAVAPIRLSFDTKSDRGNRLLSGAVGDARKAEGLALTPDMNTETAFRCIARACLVQLAGNSQALHRERRPEALHQARIAIRRLRSAMTVFRPMLGDGEFPHLRAELRWAGGELNPARDLDVFIDRLGAPGPDTDLERYVERLKQARSAAYDRGLEALDSARFAKLLLDLALWVEAGAWSSDDDALRVRGRPIDRFAAEVLDDRRRRLARAGRKLREQDAAARHQVRINAKKLRYAAEFFENAFPEAVKRRLRFIEALRVLQDELGVLNDIAVAPEVSRHGVFGRGVTDLAFTAGGLVGELRASEADHIERAAKAFARFRKAPDFW